MNEKNICHIKFDEIDSTQDWAKENYLNNLKNNTPHLLASTKSQTKGIGRQGRFWDHSEQSLAFSFVAEAAKTLTKTPLEIGIICAKFFNENYSSNIKLKWPNDLIINQKKCGGIICQSFNIENKTYILAGVGININEKNETSYCEEFQSGRSSIQLKILDEEFNHTIPAKFYNYFLNHRLNDEQILDEWVKNCCHINQAIKTHQNKNLIEGIFLGLGDEGQAILSVDNAQIEIFSGEFFI